MRIVITDKRSKSGYYKWRLEEEYANKKHPTVYASGKSLNLDVVRREAILSLASHAFLVCDGQVTFGQWAESIEWIEDESIPLESLWLKKMRSA